MGLDSIITYSITVDMQSGECDIHYPMDSDLTELEMIKNLRDIVTTCYFELRDEIRLSEGEADWI